MSGSQPGGGDPTNQQDQGNSQQPRVFVLDKHGRPLQPTHPARARELLAKGRARVHRVVPFVIRLVDRTVEESVVDGVEIGIDPGSKATGIAVFTTRDVVDGSTVEGTGEGTVGSGEVSTARTGIWLGELIHRGLVIKNNMHSRAALRRGRRSRNTRYRAPRFSNRRREANHPLTGVWLPPSLNHRIDGTVSWLNRLVRWAPVRAVHVERVRFDMQLLHNPDIGSVFGGVEYQQGALYGYEVREYVLEKWGRACVYCDAPGTGPGGVPLNLDHVVAKSKGGSNAVWNLAPSCVDCNQAKDNLLIQVFLAHDPARLARITTGLKRPLRDAAAVNATRYATHRAAAVLGNKHGWVTYASTGGRTKYNRHVCGVPKTHALDALCVGDLGPHGAITNWPTSTHIATSTGRGSYARTRSDKHGFPRLRLTRTKQHHGYLTGDLVRAVVPTGVKAGTHTGRVAVRATGSVNITTHTGTVQGINHRHLTLIQRGDGYRHTTQPTPTRITSNRKENAA